MKTSKKLFLFVFSMLFFSFILFPISAKGQFADLDFEFQKDTLYNNESVDNEFNSTFNLRNQGFYNGTYLATFSFTNDTVGADPEGWTIDQPLDTTVGILGDKSGHRNVLYMADNTATDSCSAISPQINSYNEIQVIEWWVRITSITTTAGLQFTFFETGTRLFIFYIDANDFGHFDGGYNNWGNNDVVANTWMHIRLILDNNAETFDCYLNLELVQANNDYENSPTNGMNKLKIETGSNDIFSTYVDAIDYKWIKTWDVLSFFDFSEFVGAQEFNTSREPYTEWSYVNGTNAFTAKLGQDAFRMIDGDSTAQVAVRAYENNTADMISWRWRPLIQVGNIIQFNIFADDNDPIIHLQYEDDWITDKTGGADDDLLAIPQIAVWTTFRIYLDFQEDFATLLINDTFIANIDFAFGSDNDLFESFQINTMTVPNKGICDFVNFTFGLLREVSNIIPILEETLFLEVDKYEFALKDVNTFNELGVGSANSWSEIENGYNHTYLAQDLTPPNNPYVSDPPYPIGSAEDNRVFQVVGDGDTHEFTGIEKTSIGIEEGLIDISFTINATQLDNAQGGMKFYIYSYDTTLNTGFVINWTTGNNGAIYNYESGGTWALLNNIGTSTLTIDDKIEFVVNIGNFNYLRVYDNGVLVGTYGFPLVDTSKEGLNRIQIFSEVISDAGNDNIINIHSVGIYLEGSSICEEEMGRVLIETNDGRWDRKQHYNFFIEGNGKFLLGMGRIVYYVGTPIYQNITGFEEHNSTLIHYNSYDGTYVIFSNATIIFHVLGGNFNMSAINIEGAKLVQNSNEYSLVFTHGGVDIDESYFYVDSNNKLQFIHNSDDAGVEFIQALFDINDFDTNDSTIGWTGRRDNNAFAYLRLKFESTSNVYELRPFVDSKKVLLASGKVIEEFIILVSDNELFGIDGLTTGYITSISLEYAPDIIISVITSNMITMIIPLMMILVPTISISEYYGKNLFIPLFLFMTVILGITGTIPLWLFFVSGISLSLFIFTRRNKEREVF